MARLCRAAVSAESEDDTSRVWRTPREELKNFVVGVLAPGVRGKLSVPFLKLSHDVMM